MLLLFLLQVVVIFIICVVSVLFIYFFVCCFFFQVVVIFIICVVSVLFIYMCFLLCLDPLITKRPRAQYQQQVNEEVNLVISGQRALSHLFHIAFLNQSLLQLFIISFFNSNYLYLHWVIPCTFYKVIFKYIHVCIC